MAILEEKSLWVSCGWRFYHSELSLEENQYWYGDLHSQTGAGGNFLLSFQWELLPDLQNELVNKLDTHIRDISQKWDHKFLNDVFGDKIFSPENLVQELGVQVQSVAIKGVKWRGVKIRFSEKQNAVWSFGTPVEHHLQVRLQSLIKSSSEKKQFQGVDAKVTLNFSGEKMPQTFTWIPVQEVWDWEKIQLPDILRTQSLDEWLGVSLVEELPEALYHQLQRQWPNLKGLHLQLDPHFSLGFCANK